MKALLVDKSPDRLMSVFAGGPGSVFSDSSHLRYMDITDPRPPAGWIRIKKGASLKPMNVDLSPVWYNEVNLLGTVSHCNSLWQGGMRGDFELAIEWMLEGKLITDGFITNRFRLDQYREAILAAADKKKYHSVKVVFQF